MSFKSLAVAFINTNAKLSTLAADMRAHFEDPSDRAFVRSECMPIIAEHYNIKLVAKERGEGFTLPESHKSYKTAANMLSLMVNAIVGERSGHTQGSQGDTRHEGSGCVVHRNVWQQGRGDRCYQGSVIHNYGVIQYTDGG